MQLNFYTVSKNVTTLSCYNIDTFKPILIIFGRNITEKLNSKGTSFSNLA